MKNNKDGNFDIFSILGIITLVALVAIAGCIDKESNESKNNTANVNVSTNVTPVAQVTSEQGVVVTPISQGTSGTGVSSGTSGMIERYNLDKLVSMSDSIVIAEVVNVLPSRWNTQNGEKPTTADGISGIIYTDADVKVVEYLKGKLDSTTITVRIIGGTVGKDKQYVEDQPSYSANEKVLIFLKNDSDPRTKDVGSKHMTTAGLLQGKISIPENNLVVIGDEEMTLDGARTIIAGKGEK